MLIFCLYLLVPKTVSMKKQLLFLLLFLSFIGVHAQTLTASAVITQPLTCINNGAVVVTATGGTEPYTYSIAPSSGVVLTGNVFSNFSAGTYTISVIDSSSPQQQVDRTVTFSQPIQPTVTATATNNNIVATSSGGIQPVRYRIAAPVAYATPYLASGIFPCVHPGVYTVEVVDGYGCVGSTVVTVQPTLDLQVFSNYVDYNNDGFTNVGDLINYQFEITNNNPLEVVNNVTLFANGLNINGGIIFSLSGTDTTTFSATHVITQTDINNGFVTFDFNINGFPTSGCPVASYNVIDTENLNFSDGIKLNAFIDSNTNGVQDNGEQNFTQGNFQYQINDDGINHNVITSTGVHYIYEVNPVNSYDLSYSIGNVANPSQYSLATSSYSNITVASGYGITTYNFPVTVLPHKDLAITLTPYGPSPRPGFTYINRLTYKNYGSEAINSGILTFTKDSAVTIVGISQAGTIANSNGFSYNFANLLPGEVRYIDITMQVPTIPTVALGQVVTNGALGVISGTDINSVNDFSNLSQIIIGSYDPNDKIESHGGKILHSSFTSNDYLTYTIQFENTGTANAVNVRLNDVLDAKLDETSVRMINASHDYALDRVGNNLNWKFNGIELEPSVANTAIGKGCVTFQIKPKPGYAIGDIIPNTASIYFDFNPAIVTNTFNTEFVSTLSVANFESESFAVYPNPTNDFLNISSKNSSKLINNIVVSDILGKTVQTNSFNTSKAVLDLSNLNRGVYFVKVESEGVDKIMKVVKQ